MEYPEVLFVEENSSKLLSWR